MRWLLSLVLLFNFHWVQAQEDSLENERLARMVQLTEVVVRNNLDVPRFIDRIRKDTSFYKAFRNLRVLSFSSLNDIRMLDKKGRLEAALQSETRQTAAGGCRTMEKKREHTSGKFYTKKGQYNYYTAELYASLFFTNGKVCGEDNIVKGLRRDIRNKRGMDKHREQLKMLFFDPGQKIGGVPLMGDKMAIFDEDQSRYYDFLIDQEDYNGVAAYKFSIIAKKDAGGRVVIDEMITWFRVSNWDILGRNYRLSYKAGVYDFNVQLEVKMQQYKNYLVPALLRYSGYWNVALKKKERGLFTATLFGFDGG